MADEKAYTELFVGLLFIIIGVTLLTSFAPTVHTATDTSLNSTGGTLGTTGALVNVSTTAKTVYGFTDLVWAGGSIVFVILGIFGVAMAAKNMVSK